MKLIRNINVVCIYVTCMALSGCSGNQEETLFSLVRNSGIDFTNTVEYTKEFNIFSYRNFYNGGGVAIGDINNDGLPEVLMTSNTGSNKLFLNKGNFQFEDISEKAGIQLTGKWNTGVVMADVNGDGWLDIYICNAGYNKWANGDANALFINNRDLTFTEKAHEFGLDEKGYTTHAAFFDYDLDGDLDCYILNNSFIPVNTLNYSNKRDLPAKDWDVEDFVKGGGDKLLRNDGGFFSDVSEEAGIYGSLIGFGLGVTVGDVNGDHYPDLYISNDFFERDYLYINKKNGTFHEELEQWMEHTSLASMGADLADINNDGYPDIFTTDMLPGDEYRLKTTSSFENFDLFQIKLKKGFYNQYQQNALQVNNQNGKFKETAYYSGVSATDWSWGALIFDADNDGLSDLYVCNGIYKDVIDQDFIDFFANDVIQRMVTTGEKEEVQRIIDSMPSVPIPNFAFRNTGNLQFTNEGKKWGFSQPSFSNGAAYADLDNDGDLDLVVNNVNMPCFVYRNNAREQNGHRYIGFQLKGKSPNTFAVGSLIRIYSGDQVMSREVIPSRGFQSSIGYTIIAGLGSRDADSVRIDWPDQSVTRLYKPEVNKTHQIDQAEALLELQQESTGEIHKMFMATESEFRAHKENEFVDFYNERNVPVMLSREGPRAVTADVNGDGMEDLFIGGAAGQAGVLYIQTKRGYQISNQPVFEVDKDFEDVALLFFDCDRDGDPDLFVGSGGNNLPPSHPMLQHRLYINNGKGDFIKDNRPFQVNSSNISTAIALDYNNDGDLDLFLGGRSLSYNYGADPESFLLDNNGKGAFTDVTQSVSPEISRIGMVTDAAWADFDQDKTRELLIVGDWMTPQLFKFINGKAIKRNTGLENISGWWQRVAVGDLDGDGDPDLVLGNYGKNFYLRPEIESPVRLYRNDFDLNSIQDNVFSRTVEGKDVPVFLKKDFSDALPAMKKENLRHHEYAKKTINTLFREEQLKQAQVKIFNYSSSIIAWNDGSGKFSIQELPMEAQLSNVNAVLCKDLNADGLNDLVLAGNNTACLPQFGRLDANYGLVLINQGNHKFRVLPSAVSGITITGMVRDIAWIQNKQSAGLLFLRNNDLPVLYYQTQTKNR